MQMLGREIYPLEVKVNRHSGGIRKFVTALPGIADLSKSWYSHNNLLLRHSAQKFF